MHHMHNSPTHFAVSYQPAWLIGLAPITTTVGKYPLHLQMESTVGKVSHRLSEWCEETTKHGIHFFLWNSMQGQRPHLLPCLSLTKSPSTPHPKMISIRTNIEFLMRSSQCFQTHDCKTLQQLLKLLLAVPRAH